MFYKEMYFLTFLKKFPFSIRVFQTNVCEAASEQGGWVAHCRGRYLMFLLCKWFPGGKFQLALQGDNI